MPIKYYCRKCGKRYVEWGAEKLGFQCPDCSDEQLIRVGTGPQRPSRKPSLRKRTAPVRQAAKTPGGNDAVAADVKAPSKKVKPPKKKGADIAAAKPAKKAKKAP